MATSSRAAQRALTPATARAGGLLVKDSTVPAGVRDAYAQTLLNMRFALYGATGNTVLVAAVDATSNAAVVATNLAILAAQEGERVILVDTNAHAPSLNTLFDLAETPGFTSLIRQEGLNPTASLQQVDIPNLYLLSVEQGKTVPGGLGRATGLTEVLQRLKHVSDRVILLGAPILLHVDSLDLCPIVDGVIVTICPDATHREDAGRARSILNRVRAPVLGVVLSKHGA